MPDFCHYGRTMTEKSKADRIWRTAKAGEYILIPHYYYIDDEHGNVIYDTDLMKEEFEKELEALIQQIKEDNGN